MKVTKIFVQILLILLTASSLKSQDLIRCGTHESNKNLLMKNPALKQAFDINNNRMVKGMRDRSSRRDNENDTIFIPIVFHILVTDQSVVSDQQVFEQLIRLNEDFAGKNADSTVIPSYFKPLQGKSIIQFKLAQRTPGLDETTGIIRYPNALASYNVNDIKIHYTSMGGADVWDPTQYINVWVGKLQNQMLGQASYPNVFNPEEDGIIIDYGTLPNGYFAPFNQGRTLTHEMGHFFFLYHIWGDDDGACNGSDEIDDTPNQAGSTSGCHTGKKFDSCTPSGDGIMYQNFMDYSADGCMVMFTNQQIARMMTALDELRPSLKTSLGHEPVMKGQNNVSVLQVAPKANRVCEPENYYDITFKNIGSEKITQLVCSLAVNNSVNIITIDVDLDTYETFLYRLNTSNLQQGNNQVAIEVLKVNNVNDDDPSDNLRVLNTIYAPLKTLPFFEDFSVAGFPPVGWYVNNPDNSLTWAPSGMQSAYIANYQYNALGQKDELILPPIVLPDVDSVFFTFDVAAAIYSSLSEDLTIWDTLKVEISDGCSTSYQTVYSKTKDALMTIPSPTNVNFVPQNASQWRKDSIDLSSFRNQTVTIKFTNVNGYENNIFLDNIGFRTVGLPAALKEQGYLIAPNPVTDIVQIRLLETPEQLRRLAIYDINGRRVMYETVNKGNFYQMNLSSLPKGVYFITIETETLKHTQKIIKL